MRKFSIILAAFLLSSCYQKGADAPRSDTAPQSPMAINIETLAQGLEFPWGMDFLPDGSVLVTEKAGRLRLLKDNKLSPPINGLPKDILYDGQAGLFDVVAHPDSVSYTHLDVYKRQVIILGSIIKPQIEKPMIMNGKIIKSKALTCLLYTSRCV